MVESLDNVTLKSGETVAALAVRGPDASWRERLERLLAHKGEPWNWQNSALLGQPTGVDAWFYVLHRNGAPFAHLMTAAVDGVGIFGHVWTEPADRGQGAAAALMRLQLDHFRARAGRCLILSTTPGSTAYRLYEKLGYVALEPGSGYMTWSREPFDVFAEGYLRAPGTAAITDLAWPHWPVASVLFAAPGPGVVRCAPLGVFGRKSSEGELLPVLHNRAMALPTATVRVLALANGAVGALAAAHTDPFSPDSSAVDACWHPAWADRVDGMLAEVLAACPGRTTAYADPAQTDKVARLERHGFRRATTWPKHLRADAAGTARVDLLMFERGA